MNNKIGVMSTTYSNYDLEYALKGIANGGFKYIELSSVIVPGQFYKEHVFIDPNDIKMSAKLCKKYGITIVAVCAHGRLMMDNAVENFKKCIDAVNDLEVSYINTGTGDVENEKDQRRFYEEISLLGEYAAKKNITICLEIHDAWFSNGRVASEIVRKIGMENIKINYDTANVIYFGDTRPEDDIQNTLGNLGLVHLKDKRGGYNVWDFPALGEGEIDFKAIFNALKNYNGPMLVEIEFTEEKQPLEEVDKAVKKSYEFLKNFDLTL
ncbi:MAG: sugar phosphate isomerase/epimerase [Actinobacteria bacterium]|nr:sugar phosphate isomerase/epimerase [Actinomycetota bacterium]